MNTFIARLGQLETRRTAQTIWSSGKRKRARSEWMCVQCRHRQEEKRLYSGTNSWRIGTHKPSLARASVSTESRREWSTESRARNTSDEGYEPGEHNTSITYEETESAALFHDDLSVRGNGADGVITDNLEQDLSQEPFEVGGHSDRDQHDHLSRMPSRMQAAISDLIRGLDYKSALPRALAKGEVDLAARCILAAESASDMEFVASLPESIFSQILELLKPAGHITSLAGEYVEMSAANVAFLEMAPMEEITTQYSSVLYRLFYIRRKSGQKPSLRDYTILLRSARDLGSRQLAVKLWQHLSEDGYTPDTACYNHYMASIVWNGSNKVTGRRRVRITPRNMDWRGKPHDVNPSYSVGPGGVRDQALGLFKQMIQNGVAVNEETLVIAITAAAREGDLETVKSLVERGWSLDIDKVLAGKQDVGSKSRNMSKNPGMRPTSNLLFALAHAFGVNNDVPSALRVVDFVARHYSIDIDRKTWSQIAEWTFILTSVSLSDSGRRGVGEMPRTSLEQLWDTMTGAPYFAKPTMGMYNNLIKSLSDRSKPIEICDRMEEGFELFLKNRTLANKLRKDLRAALRAGDKGSDVSVENLRKQWDYHDMIRQRDILWLRRWVTLLMGSFTEWTRYNFDTVTQRLPELLWKWRDWTPTKVRYEISTGIVEFDIREEHEIEENAKFIANARRNNDRLRDSVPLFIGHHWLRGRRPAVRYIQERPRAPALIKKSRSKGSTKNVLEKSHNSQ